MTMKKLGSQLIVLIAVCISLFSFSVFADSKTVAEGELTHAFSSWGKPALKGEWKIVKEDKHYFIELADNFVAKNGPDVKIFLSPQKPSDVTGDNAVKDSVLIHQLTQFSGQYRIAIPAGTDLDRYQSLVFHCEAYSKLWGVSAL